MNQRKFDAFDLESTDEINRITRRIRAIGNVNMNALSNKIIPITPALILTDTTEENNTMNGWFLFKYTYE